MKFVIKIIWGIILIIPLIIFNFSCRNAGKRNVINYDLFKAHLCKTDIIDYNITYSYKISLERGLSKRTLELISRRTCPIPISNNKNRILISYFFPPDQNRIFSYDTTGKLVDELIYNTRLNEIQLIDDTLLLATTSEYNPKGILFNIKNKSALRKFIFPLETRFAIHYKILDNYIFTIGFQDINNDETPFNYTVGIYELNKLKFISDIAEYPSDLAIGKIRVISTSPSQVLKKDNTLYGVFSFYPIMFKYSMDEKSEKKWLLPIYKEFSIYDLKYGPDQKEVLKNKLKSYKWSVQYYADFLDDSLFIVFREHNPPYYVDMYNVKYDTPIYLGSLKIDNDWQPITSWKNRIIFLNRDLLLKENKIELKLGYIRI